MVPIRLLPWYWQGVVVVLVSWYRQGAAVVNDQNLSWCVALSTHELVGKSHQF